MGWSRGGWSGCSRPAREGAGAARGVAPGGAGGHGAAGELEEVTATTPFHRRNPRTAVGATADGRLLIVTVDGRQPGHSVGMSLRELAELFVRLGARSAMNLDAAAADPGSTAGLLEWLAAQGAG